MRDRSLGHRRLSGLGRYLSGLGRSFRRHLVGGGRRGRLDGRLRGSRPRRSDHGEHGAHLDRLSLLDADLRDHTLAGARHLGVHLVGRDLEERLVQLHALARLLEPLRDGALGYRDAHLGHHDLDLGAGAHLVVLLVRGQLA
jgi:hypothetical protein